MGVTGVGGLLHRLDHEVLDAEEETFWLFSQGLPVEQNLGFVDAKAETISVSLGVNGREISVAQSPTLLNSALSTGTTGAVLWRVSPLVATWLSDSSNILFGSEILTSESTILELGCGISGVTAIALAPRVKSYVCTDQEYVLKLLRKNLAENIGMPSTSKKKQTMARDRTARKTKATSSSISDSSSSTTQNSIFNVQIVELDWETSSVSSLPTLLGPSMQNLDVIIACDCIYNSHLIPPFVQTCAEICRLRETELAPDRLTLCLVAQQLRSPEVFEEWLRAFMQEFRAWRIPDLLLDKDLQSDKGFSVHIGILQKGGEYR